MHKQSLLQKTLGKSLSFMHKKRQDVIFLAVEAIMNGASLTLSSMGRYLQGKAKERNQIRKMDRLLGNKHLQSEKALIYEATNSLLMKSNNHIVILVDWSCLSSKDRRYLLRASMSVKGRSITCYQEVHPKENENNTEAHNSFLSNLKAVLPDEIKPIIVTDALFSTLWFKKVISYGWNFVGRVRRNRGSYYCEQEEKWNNVEAGFNLATGKPEYQGKILLTKRNKLPCHFISYKKAHKGRKKFNRKGTIAKGSYTEVISKSALEPWFLVTSLSPEKYSAQEIVQYYSKRMQIEEEFRDTKNSKYGFGLSESGTKIHSRVEILLIINLLASLYCWLLACATVVKKKHVDYHANSVKTNTVLSSISLGFSVYRKMKRYSQNMFQEALSIMRAIIGGEKVHDFN